MARKEGVALRRPPHADAVGTLLPRAALTAARVMRRPSLGPARGARDAHEARGQLGARPACPPAEAAHAPAHEGRQRRRRVTGPGAAAVRERGEKRSEAGI